MPATPHTLWAHPPAHVVKVKAGGIPFNTLFPYTDHVGGKPTPWDMVLCHPTYTVQTFKDVDACLPARPSVSPEEKMRRG